MSDDRVLMHHAAGSAAARQARVATVGSSRKPRVVLVQTQAEGAGAQEIARILGHGLEARGYEVHYVFFFRRTAAFDAQPNTFFCARERPTGPVQLARMMSALLRHLRALKPDAVLCFQHYGNVIGTVAARLAGIRHVIANQTSAKLAAPWPARAIEHGLGITGMFDRMVVNCATVADDYRTCPYRARIVRIDHGFEPKNTALDRSAARALLGLPDNAILLGSVGRLHPGKNFAAAIRLLALEPEWRLALVGQGKAQAELAALAASLGVADRVYFLGEQPPDRVGTFLRALDVFVFPTLAETFGLAAVEAAQAGVPVVANDLPVLREVLASEGQPAALFVDVADTQAFAAAIRRLLSDQELSTSLAARGRRLAGRYSLDAMVEKYAALLTQTTQLNA